MALDLLLLEQLIQDEFPQVFFYGFDKLDSTSFFLKSKSSEHNHAFCITNAQTNGYGQRQREWMSNGESLTFSLLYTTTLSLNECNGLAQYIGARVCHLLNTVCNDSVFIKWPNDLFNSDGKVSGLLVESCGKREGAFLYVIGMGINLSPISISSNDDYPLSYLSPKLPLESLVLLILDNLINSLNGFENRETDELSVMFSKYDYFKKGQNVFVYDSEHKITAEYEGVSSQGHVCLLIDNEKRCFHSGETSIRAK